MPSRRSHTRSPSPKVLFASSFDPSKPVKAQAQRLRRLSSNGSIVSFSPELGQNGSLKELSEDDPVPGDNAEGNRVKGSTRPQPQPQDKPVKVKKIDWEIPRKLFHSSIGFFVIPLYTHHISPRLVVINLSAALGIVVGADVIRFRSQKFARVYEKFLGFLMRESEKQHINGVVWYLAGCITVLSTCPLDIAVVSILILSWCDTTASLFGRLWGHLTPRLPQSARIPLTRWRIPLPFAGRKSVAGFAAAVVTGAAVGAGFWGGLAKYGAVAPTWVPQWADPLKAYVGLAVVGIVTGLVAGLAESFDVGSLDDNLTLPIVAGGLLTLFFRWFGHAL